MERPHPSTVATELRPGDEIEVITTDQRFFKMKVTQVYAEHIEGRSELELVRIPIAEIQELRYEEASFFRSVGAVVLGVLAATGLFVVAFAAARE